MAKKKSPAAKLRPPDHLTAAYELTAFHSGEVSLDDWLRRRALQNEARGASRTYVVCDKPEMRVVAYYCLAAGAVSRSGAPTSIRRNMPEPIPVMVIGRLAVDRAWQGQGLGRFLLRDAILRTVQVANMAGIRAILVHAISDDAQRFYESSGFRASPIDLKTLMISIAEAEKALKA